MGVLLVTLSMGCSGDKLYLGADARVAFSQDTVLFDTASVPLAVPARRSASSTVRAHPLGGHHIGGAADSPRINVDGIPGPSVGDWRSRKAIPLRVRRSDDRSGERLRPALHRQGPDSRHRQRIQPVCPASRLGSGRFLPLSSGGISTLDCNALWTAQSYVIYGVVGLRTGAAC